MVLGTEPSSPYPPPSGLAQHPGAVAYLSSPWTVLGCLELSIHLFVAYLPNKIASFSKAEVLTRLSWDTPWHT